MPASSSALELGLDIFSPPPAAESVQPATSDSAASAPPQNAPADPSPGAAVTLGGKTLFNVEASVGAKTRSDRAAEATKII
ncbi:MAG: hypothetical protein Fur0046_32060 [Cyanobacteria bacterium J069]